MRRVWGGAAVLAALLLITGCAPDTDPSWKPATWPITGRVLTEAPPPLDASEIALVPQRVRNDSVGVEARWAYLPGVQPVNDAVEATVRAAIAAQAAASGVAYSPQAHGADAGLGERGCVPGATSAPASAILGAPSATRTVVVCEVVRAAGRVFGQRVRAITGTSTEGRGVEVTADITTTFYTDLSTGAVVTGEQLFTEATPLWDDVVEVLRRDAGSLSLLPVTAPTPDELGRLESALQSAVVDGGELVVRIPDDFSAIELNGLAAWRPPDAEHPLFVAIGADALDVVLTDVGRTVIRATGAFEGPADRGAGYDRVACDLVPCMALTLDDGPSGLTPAMLDTLRAQQSAATFYMLGQNAQRHTDTVRRVAAEGHQVGNHTWNHPYLTQLTDAQVTEQLTSTGDLLRSLTGQAVATFRPPGGYIDDRVLAIAGMPAVMWSVDTRDWTEISDADLLEYAVDRPRIGTIMLMHDIQARTARVFSNVIAGLRDRGFTLVTVDRLFGGAVPPGIVRFAG